MNSEQERHAKAMADKIRVQLASMAVTMDSIINHPLKDIPVQVVESQFNELPHYMDRIYGILNDMLGELSE